eukprot:31184-Pyramimonas_sp.AAC.1
MARSVPACTIAAVSAPPVHHSAWAQRKIRVRLEGNTDGAKLRKIVGGPNVSSSMFFWPQKRWDMLGPQRLRTP